MNKQIKYLAKCFYVLLQTVILTSTVSAQTELTTEMVWQEGTHWIYPYEMWCEFPPDYYLRECRLVKYIDEKTNEEYLRVECMQMKADGSWSTEWYPSGQYLKVEGDKISASLLFRELPQYKGYYQLYDFSTWDEGETIYFEEDDFSYPTHERKSVVVNNLHRIVADPEGKYYTYAFSGKDEYSLPFYYVKGIGRVQDYSTINLVYLFFDITMNEIPGEPNRIMALKVWHPDLGVLYQHPDYEHVMELAGVESLTADEANEAIIKAGAGEVTVESTQPVEVMICTTTGVTVRRDRVIGSATYPLAPGIYIIRAGTRTCKVCI